MRRPRLITASGRAPVVLLGHSMGGFVTTALVEISGSGLWLLLVDGGLPFPLPQGKTRIRSSHRPWVRPCSDCREPSPAETPTSDSGKPILRCEGSGATRWLTTWITSSWAAHECSDPRCHPKRSFRMAGTNSKIRIRLTCWAASPSGAALGGLPWAAGQPPGLHPEEELVRWRSRLPALIIDEIPQLNHYTIMLHPSGAAQVAAAVNALS